MGLAAGIAALILGAIADGWYCLQIARGTIAPALATWLIFGVATTISLVSYLKHPRNNNSLVANLANRADPIICWVIVAFIVFAPRSDKSLHAFDFGCLAASGLIVVIWAVSGSHITANLLIQLVMLVSYLPTYHRILHERRNTESFVMWGLNLVVALLFLIAPIRLRDRLGILYAARAAGSTMLMLLFMLYFQWVGF